METVQSVDRALTILELLSEDYEGLGITEVSSKTGLHKSTVHRLLGTLVYNGFVEQNSQTNKYKISLKLFEMGIKRLESANIMNVCKPFTTSLMGSINEVVHVVIRDKNDIVYIDKVEADNTIRMASTIGKRSPLYCTSVGKSILAFMPEDEVDKVWNSSNIQKLTKNTIVDYKKFKEELEVIRINGYSIDDEENELGVRCVGSPVFNHKGEIEGAISISGPITRVTKDKLSEIAIEVKKYAYLISRELGYRS